MRVRVGQQERQPMRQALIDGRLECVVVRVSEGRLLSIGCNKWHSNVRVEGSVREIGGLPSRIQIVIKSVLRGEDHSVFRISRAVWIGKADSRIDDVVRLHLRNQVVGYGTDVSQRENHLARQLALDGQ